MEIQRRIENMYHFCMEEKKSGMKLSPNRVWDRTAALTGVSRFTGSLALADLSAWYLCIFLRALRPKCK